MRASRRFFAIALMSAAFVAPAFAESQGDQAPPDRQSRLTSADSYMPIPTLSAGVIQRYDTVGTMIIDMGLDIPDPALRTRAQANAPLLRDALRTALATYASTYYRERTCPDPDTATRLMQSAVDRTLRAPGARVLLVNIIFQRRTG